MFGILERDGKVSSKIVKDHMSLRHGSWETVTKVRRGHISYTKMERLRLAYVLWLQTYEYRSWLQFKQGRYALMAWTDSGVCQRKINKTSWHIKK